MRGVASKDKIGVSSRSSEILCGVLIVPLLLGEGSPPCLTDLDLDCE